MNKERRLRIQRIMSSLSPARALVLAVVVFLSASPVFAKFDSSFVWTTLETRHFLARYHQGGEEAARKAAAPAIRDHAGINDAVDAIRRRDIEAGSGRHFTDDWPSEVRVDRVRPFRFCRTAALRIISP